MNARLPLAALPIGAVALTAFLLASGAAPEHELRRTPADVQGRVPGASPLVGETVRVEGTVTGTSPHGDFYYVADPAGGPWSGLKVEGVSLERFRGESVVVEGTVREEDQETRLTERRAMSFGAGKLPPASLVTLADLTLDAEAWEGVLVRVEDVTVQGNASRFGEYDIADGTGFYEVDDEFFTSYVAESGDTFESMTGIVAWGFGDFHLEPRDDDDLAGFVSGRTFDAEVRVTVTDETGAPLPAKATFLLAGGGGGLSLGPEHRVEGSEDVAYLPDGEAVVPVPSGSYDVVVSRGIEYGLHRERVDVSPGGMAFVNAVLPREVDSSGWISGDFHLHAAPSSDTGMPVPGRIVSLAAEGVEWAIATDHNMVTDYTPVIEELGLTAWIRSSIGQEITTRSPSFGHFNAWPLPAGSAPRPWEGLDPAALFAAARSTPQEEIVQVNHPSIPEWGNQYFDVYRMDPYLGEPQEPGWSWDFDAVEVFNGRHLDQGLTTLRTWMRFLNAGRFITATGNSDSHHLVFTEPGYPRNYVASSTDSPGETDEKELVESVRRGAAFLTYGPLVDFTIDGARLGELVTPGAVDDVRLRVRVQCASWLSVEEAIVYANGQEIAELRLAVDRPGPVDVTRTLTHRPTADTWYAVVVRGGGDLAPVRRGSGFQPFALTNPIRVDADRDGTFTPPGNVADAVTIAEVDAVDESGVTRNAGRWVSFEGVATTDTEFGEPGTGRFYVDDDTGGVQVRESVGGFTPLTRGDRVWVGGFVGQVLGETMIVDATVENLGPGSEPGAVRSLDTGALDFSVEPWEGRVVEVSRVDVVGGAWPTGGASGSVTVDDGTGPAKLEIPPGVVLPEGVETLTAFSFTALVTQADFSPPYTTRYALTLRSGDDLSDASGRALSAPDFRAGLGVPRPNPFRTRLTVPVSAPEDVAVEVLDVTGRRVRRLEAPAGTTAVEWDGRDARGRATAAGVYFVRMAGEGDAPRRVVKLR